MKGPTSARGLIGSLVLGLDGRIRVTGLVQFCPRRGAAFPGRVKVRVSPGPRASYRVWPAPETVLAKQGWYPHRHHSTLPLGAACLGVASLGKCRARQSRHSPSHGMEEAPAGPHGCPGPVSLRLSPRLMLLCLRKGQLADGPHTTWPNPSRSGDGPRAA